MLKLQKAKSAGIAVLVAAGLLGFAYVNYRLATNPVYHALRVDTPAHAKFHKTETRELRRTDGMYIINPGR